MGIASGGLRQGGGAGYGIWIGFLGHGSNGIDWGKDETDLMDLSP